MPKIVRMQEITSIKPGDPPQIAEDGTILNPVPYYAVNILLDDGREVQVDRPVTKEKLRRALEEMPGAEFDELKHGQKVARYAIGDIIRLRWWRP